MTIARSSALLLLASLVACGELKGSSDPADGGETDASGGGTDAGLTDAPPGTADAGTDASVTPHLVFVTSAQVNGAFGSGGDPLLAADTICKNEATANTLSGTFVAWLSYTDGNGTAFNAATRIPDAPYAMPGTISDGGAPVLIAATKAALLTDGPLVPLDRLANGERAPQDENELVTWVWTGTNGSGSADSQTCQRWTSATFETSGTAGNARRIPQFEPTDWTSLGGRTCDVKRRFYCFQK